MNFVVNFKNITKNTYGSTSNMRPNGRNLWGDGKCVHPGNNGTTLTPRVHRLWGGFTWQEQAGQNCTHTECKWGRNDSALPKLLQIPLNLADYGYLPTRKVPWKCERAASLGPVKPGIRFRFSNGWVPHMLQLWCFDAPAAWITKLHKKRTQEV